MQSLLIRAKPANSPRPSRSGSVVERGQTIACSMHPVGEDELNTASGPQLAPYTESGEDMGLPSTVLRLATSHSAAILRILSNRSPLRRCDRSGTRGAQRSRRQLPRSLPDGHSPYAIFVLSFDLGHRCDVRDSVARVTGDQPSRAA
jgi:hypothetical protein